MEYFDYKIYMQKSDSFEYIVQRRRVQQYERTIYDCFLCKSYSHSSLQSIYEHFQEHEHKKNQRKYRHRYGLSGTAIDIIPNDPVYKNIAEEGLTLGNALTHFPGLGIIGLEYIVERIRGIGLWAKYYCTLCQCGGFQLFIIHHLSSFKHQSTYLNLHFPAAQSFLESLHLNLAFTYAAVNYGCRRVEAHYKRLEPFQCSDEQFRHDRLKISHGIFKGPHYTENRLNNFSVYDKKALERKCALMDPDIYERYDEHKLQNRINSHDESEEKFWRDHINQKSFLIKNSQPNARRSEDFSRNREYHNHQFIDQDHLVYCRKRQRSSEGFSPEPKRARRSISIEYNCYNPSLISICHILSSLNNFIKKFSSKLRRLYEKCVAFGNNENAQNELVINRLNWYLLWDIAKKLKKRLLNELLTKRCEADMTRVVVDIQKLLFKYPKRQKIKMNSVSLENVPTDVTQSTLEESSFTSGQTHDTKESKELSDAIDTSLEADSADKEDLDVIYVGLQKLDPKTVSRVFLVTMMENFNVLSLEIRTSLLLLLSKVHDFNDGRVEGLEKYICDNN